MYLLLLLQTEQQMLWSAFNPLELSCLFVWSSLSLQINFCGPFCSLGMAACLVKARPGLHPSPEAAKAQ